MLLHEKKDLKIIIIGIILIVVGWIFVTRQVKHEEQTVQVTGVIQDIAPRLGKNGELGYDVKVKYEYEGETHTTTYYTTKTQKKGEEVSVDHTMTIEKNVGLTKFLHVLGAFFVIPGVIMILIKLDIIIEKTTGRNGIVTKIKNGLGRK